VGAVQRGVQRARRDERGRARLATLRRRRVRQRHGGAQRSLAALLLRRVQLERGHSLLGQGLRLHPGARVAASLCERQQAVAERGRAVCTALAELREQRVQRQALLLERKRLGHVADGQRLCSDAGEQHAAEGDAHRAALALRVEARAGRRVGAACV